MSEFKKFSQQVHAKYAELSRRELYVTEATGDDIYNGYLTAFPEGTNPIFRERTEHDCSCCRNFIKNIGRAVAIVDGELVSVWDVVGADEPYATVASYLSAYVKSFPLAGLFRTSERSYGAETSKEMRQNEDGTYVHTWNHFHGQICAKHFSDTPDKARGDYATTVGVFKRGLTELKQEAFDDVIDLIESNSLYRGAEHLTAISAFRTMQRDYQAAPNKDIFVWANANSPAARFRNTVIGTLITDISDGVELETAVKSFEKKVAPENYKRPTALITPRMVEDAMKTINSLGLEPALERRMARLSDVSINDVLWVDNAAGAKMKGGLESLLMEAAVKPSFDPKHAEDIGINEFMSKVLPQVSAIDLVVKNSQQGNFVTLTAPVHADAAPLFKWKNGFAWSYSGGVTDAIKERVKAAGGQVDGDLCCRLAWDYTDDLDFHMFEPDGNQIYFGNRRQTSRCGGMLDVDANGMDGIRTDPVENIFYADRAKMKEGVYELKVNNYNRRSNGIGFEVQIEFDGQLHSIVYDKVVSGHGYVSVAKIQYKAGVFSIINSLPATAGAGRPGEKWGVATEHPTKVATILKSPNHWDGERTGNLHWIFVLDGCRNPEPCRGVYNEFLAGGLEQHRKVFEVVGARTKCQPTDDQLSGVGFSSTRADKVLVNVTGDKIRKTYNIIF